MVKCKLASTFGFIAKLYHKRNYTLGCAGWRWRWSTCFYQTLVLKDTWEHISKQS